LRGLRDRLRDRLERFFLSFLCLSETKWVKNRKLDFCTKKQHCAAEKQHMIAYVSCFHLQQPLSNPVQTIRLLPLKQWWNKITTIQQFNININKQQTTTTTTDDDNINRQQQQYKKASNIIIIINNNNNNNNNSTNRATYCSHSSTIPKFSLRLPHHQLPVE
jgi:hypothetical protein